MEETTVPVKINLPTFKKRKNSSLAAEYLKNKKNWSAQLLLNAQLKPL